MESAYARYLVVNMEEESDLVTKLEPFFFELGATIETSCHDCG